MCLLYSYFPEERNLRSLDSMYVRNKNRKYNGDKGSAQGTHRTLLSLTEA